MPLPNANYGSAEPPQYILNAIGDYDRSKYRWNPTTMSLEGPEGSFYYGDVADPSLGTNVTIDGNTQNFAQGEVPYTFFHPGGTSTVVEGSPEYHALREDARTRNEQGIARVASVVGGGAALGATGGPGPVFGGGGAAPGAAATFPYAAGGPVTVSPLAGAGAAAGVGGGTAASSAGILDSSGAIIPGTEGAAGGAGGGIGAKISKFAKLLQGGGGGGGGAQPQQQGYVPMRQSFAGFDPNPMGTEIGTPMASPRDRQRNSKLIELLMRNA